MKRILAALALAALQAAAPPPAHAAPGELHVRVTYYYATGNRMYSGHWPFPGAAACSWNLPLGSVLAFADGRRVMCLDRGMLGSAGWIDLFAETRAAGRDIATSYGSAQLVAVERWGRE